jgi:hypothetical protein
MAWNRLTEPDPAQVLESELSYQCKGSLLKGIHKGETCFLKLCQVEMGKVNPRRHFWVDFKNMEVKQW